MTFDIVLDMDSNIASKNIILHDFRCHIRYDSNSFIIIDTFLQQIHTSVTPLVDRICKKLIKK